MATPEAEHFAALLKELKGRSGRSYGVLAGRLHVSTSTLHRYCNGDAVPNEYAPVERFARLCGASGDELVEVHRRWIVADAARRRPPGAAVSGRGTEAVAPKPAALEPAVPEPVAPVRAAEPAPEPGPAAEPAPVPGNGPAPTSVPETEPESAPTALVTGPPPPAGDRDARPARWSRLSRRTRVLIAAAGVAALLVPTAVVAADLAGSRSGDAAAAPDRGAPEGDAPLAPPSRTPAPASSSPSPGSPSASPSTPSPSSGTPSAGPSEGKGGPAGSGSGEEEAESGGTGLGAPPSVTISSYNWDEPCGQFYLLDRGPKGVSPPPPPQDRRAWAESYGGVDAGNMLLQLTVQGTSREAVVLKGLYVRVLSRKAPLPWSAYLMGNGCGSGIAPQTFASDLDTRHPIITPVPGTQGDRTIPARPFPFKVTSEDVEVFNLDMKAVGYDVTWYLELKWSSGGREGMLRIDDHGKPFRTSGMRGRPAYTYGNDEVKWEPYEGG
ncbi:helix-turn-helix transcriptional regulator [Streptomyces sp. DvalAA-19]|uniref:helix-turn-helix domain-containing protein n=1 Tax=Streptomyces sp. DvalAA-19 TaxID=1839761 RepID=UPI00081AFC82|nr:helix-turn-helix transcriptional regulator [Streptomyces sp. DvalAA-19]SCD36387.1 Helix-turn-helix domain-containing protein [Streptomyces sp. DvalAA-19]